MGVLQVQDRNLNFRHAVWDAVGKAGDKHKWELGSWNSDKDE